MKQLICDVCGEVEENADYDGGRERFYFASRHGTALIQVEIVIMSALDLCYSCVTKVLGDGLVEQGKEAV